jgi:transposase
MKILALDIGKYKTVACDYEAETAIHSFATVVTTPKALHDLLVDREPDRVVIEICSIAGWVCDLVRALYRDSGSQHGGRALAVAQNKTEE